ncbi:MAG: patatin family protein [Salinivirgaceae bacterium]|nr:patatin family protein [Salinivirgaceae bacterium]
MKRGLILEGGAMRGMFTSGVLDVLMENGIEFDGAIGVSAGATFGCNIKSRQPGRAIRYNKRFSHDWRYCSLRSLLTTGDLYGADFCYNELPKNLDLFDFDTYRSNPMEFWVVASDCETGKPVYKRLDTCNDSDLTWMRASASMPAVSRIVEIDGRKLLDGGMTDSIPIDYFESIGYNRNVVVLTQPASYRKKPNRLLWLMRLFLRHYPMIIKAMRDRHIEYNRTTAAVHQRAAQGDVLVICPDKPLGISRTERNPDELQRVYDEGRRVATERINEIRKFLEMKEK